MKRTRLLDDYVRLAVKDAEKASEIVAKSFYKILRKNGFTHAQIFNVANNILDCLIQALEAYKDREKPGDIPHKKTPRDADPALINERR